MVARSLVSAKISESPSGRIADHRKVRKVCYRRGSSQPHGLGAMARTAEEPKNRGVDRKIPGRRLAAAAICLHSQRSPRPLRSARGTFRTLGSRETYVGIFAGRRRSSCPMQQEDTSKAVADRLGKNAVIF